MLQIRRRKLFWKLAPIQLLCLVLLVCHNFAKGDDDEDDLIKNEIRRGERVIRHGDVNIVVLDEVDRKKTTPPLGLLSTTARTFIQEGTTTEYATQVYGTIVGNKYAHIVSTGSKIFYDNNRYKENRINDPIITFPSIDSLIFSSDENLIIPTKVSTKTVTEKYRIKEHKKPESPDYDVTTKIANSLKPNVHSIPETPPVMLDSKKNEPKNMVYIKKENSIRPAKVKQRNLLPTFTVKHDTEEPEFEVTDVTDTLRSPKILVQPSLAINPETTTITYFGFADFNTTSGNTVIVFTPKTQSPTHDVTSIRVEPTLSSRHVPVTFTREITTTEPIEVSEITTELKDNAETTTMEEKLVEQTSQSDAEVTTEPQDTTTENEVTTEPTFMTTESNMIKDGLVDATETSSENEEHFTELNKGSEATTKFNVDQETTTISDDNEIKTTTEFVDHITEMNGEEHETTTTGASTTEVNESQAEDIKTTTENEEVPTTTEPVEEEIDLIFKTLYTTYTYLTTYFEKSTTKVKSREEVVTNIVSTTLDPAFITEATDPAIAGLFRNRGKVTPTRTKVAVVTKTKEPFDGDEISSSLNFPDSEVMKITPALDRTPELTTENIKTKYTTYTSFSTMTNDGKTSIINKTEVYSNVISPTIATINTPPILEETSSKNRNHSIKHTPVYSYKITIRRLKPTPIPLVNDSETIRSEIIIKNNTHEIADADALTNEINLTSVMIPMTNENDGSVTSGIRRSTDETTKKSTYEDDAEDDQISSESNTEEIRPDPSLILLQTSFITYTYFTTIYKGTTSNIVSRLETVTSINTESIKPTKTETFDEIKAPITYYTTQTYWTYYKDGNTLVQSREETESNVVFPTSTQEAQEIVKPTEVLPLESTSDAVTYFTTFTYFTTSYIGNSSVVNSRLETLTNVVNSSQVGSTENYESDDIHPVFEHNNELMEKVHVNNTNVTISANDTKPTGIISINEGKIIDAFGISTTFYTTKVVGTYIDQLYAEQIESTSSIKVDTDRQTSGLINPSTTIIGDKIFQTGLLQLMEGSIVKDHTTTFYESRIIGTVNNNKYTSVVETSTSILVNNIQPTVVLSTGIKPTSTLNVTSNIETNLTSSTLSPTVIQSSINEANAEEDENDEDDKSKEKANSSLKKPFSPVIRPFASRSRPTFLPKKKTSDTLNAATIIRGITPTVVATPALKTSDRTFGSISRNRFASNRKSSTIVNSPVSEARYSNTNSKKFNRSKSTSTYLSSTLQYKDKGQSSTTTLSSFKRGGYRPSSTLKNSDYRSSSTTSGGSRFRIRPTTTGRFLSSTLLVSSTTEEPFDSNDITEPILSSSNDDAVETLPPTTTESLRKNNPLLRFRKPLASRTPTVGTTTPKTTTPRKFQGARKADNRIVTTKGTTTTKSPPRSRTPSVLGNNNSRPRPKPANSLFPTKAPLRKAESDNKLIDQQEIDENNLSESKIEEQTSDDETESEETVIDEVTERTTRKTNLVSIKPFPNLNRRGRNKRQTEFGYRYENTRSQNTRYRRPTVQNTFSDYLYYDDLEYTTEDYTRSGRNSYSKSRNVQQVQQSYQQPYQQSYQITTPIQNYQQQIYQAPKIRPTSTTTSTGRSQFTLREKSQTTTSSTPKSSYRRNTPAPRKQTENTYTTKRSRLRSYTTTTESYRNSRKQTTSRRTNTRSRYKDADYNTNLNTIQSNQGGTITVTYKIPTEVTIPIFNGKSTEYKNLVTSKPSLQVLAPHQYTTVIGKNGGSTLQLTNDFTSTLPNGVTEITRFVIQETPTTSITFTPTTIRGRKTSFSHIVPSTLYEVKSEISTIQPQLNANAPLANLLLSQLLLGNFGIQQTLNPLFGLNQPAATPVTEFKTRTTSYVTTITHSTSTVIPVTFRGKEIKTTVIDSSTQVIQATEYITDTVVITPTNVIPQNNNQLNTLLPALLQAQLLNQQVPMIVTTPVDENIENNLQEIQESSFKIKNDGNTEAKDDITEYAQRETQRKKLNKNDKKFNSPIEPAETSVVTLYVSGRRPGEFSTVLSTVTLDEKPATVRKRNVQTDNSFSFDTYEIPTISSTLEDFDNSLDEIIKSGMNDISLERADQETQSLESIMGDVSDYVIQESITVTPVARGVRDSSLLSSQNHFLLNTSTDNTPYQWNHNENRSYREKRSVLNITSNTELKRYSKTNFRGDKVNGKKPSNFFNKSLAKTNFSDTGRIQIQVTDEEGRGRHNLVTKIMSNGVEVIVALDKSTLPGSPQVLRVLPTTNIRPITLTPSTLTENMIMMLPHGLQDASNPFVTKTYLTTYTYLTTFLQDESIVVSSTEKTVSNVLTDSLIQGTNSLNVDAHVTLSSSPVMTTSVFQTTYAIENTIGGEKPQVITTHKTVSNTVTAPNDFIQFLQPSEPTIAEYNMDTSTKELQTGDYTVKPTEHLNSQIYINNNRSESIDIKPTSTQAADITKTYFVTYTYFSTLLENGTTIVKSNVATSSDVVTEKFYLPVKRTKVPANQIKDKTSVVTTPYKTNGEKHINIFATKTYLTTFTYFTTLLQDKNNKPGKTLVRSRTKVMQNVVTETLNTDLLNKDYLSNLRNSLQNDPLPITTTATLNNGQRLEITAINNNPQANEEDRISPSYEEAQSTTDKSSETNLTNKFVTTILHSPTVIKNGATLKPGTQVIKFTDANGNTSIIPLADPISKHPDGTYKKPVINKIQMNDLISLGSMGINGFNALKPVINAMAGLWQNNANSENIKDRNISVLQGPARPYDGELNVDLKPPDRTPIYIPVRPVSEDNDEAESEDFLLEQFPDVDQRNKFGAAEKPEEKPLIAGGIPISPGQVITANTDVILGTPAVLGPRPPTPIDKNDVPIGMKPPPLISYSEDGNRITNKEVIKIPPKPLSPAFLNNGFQLPKQPPKVQFKNVVDQKISLPSEIKFSHLPPNAPLKNNDNRVFVSNSNHATVSSNYPIASSNHLANSNKPSSPNHLIINHAAINSNHPANSNFPTPHLNYKPVNSNYPATRFPASNQNYPTRTQDYQTGNQNHHVDDLNYPSDENYEGENSNFRISNSNYPVQVEHSTLNPLLVNVRPSQVAQVVIPHDGQTALIYSDQPISHETKGEIFNDPSPYPEENVNPGFVGLQVYGPVNLDQPQEASKVSSNTIHLDIPINPYAADGSITESHHYIVLNSDTVPQKQQNMISSEDLQFIRPNGKYNNTVQNLTDSVPVSWDQLGPSDNYQFNSNNKRQKPFIFPQKRPTSDENTRINDYDLYNVAKPTPKFQLQKESPQQELYANNQNSHESHFNVPTINPATSLPISPIDDTPNQDFKTPDETDDYYLNQNWEILKENSTQNKIVTSDYKNSTVRGQPNIEYPKWTSIDYPAHTNQHKGNTQFAAESSILEQNSVAGNLTSNDTVTSNQNKVPLYNRNNPDDHVIGLSPPPPPLPPPSQASFQSKLKIPQPTQKQPQRPSIKKPKPSTPYPFEKPDSVIQPSRVKPTKISKPVTDSDEVMKLKPLNSTGKIEPVRKWQISTTSKPSVQLTFSDVQNNVSKKEDANLPTTTESNRQNFDTVSSHSNKLVIIGKPTNNTESSKWNEYTLETSKTDVEESDIEDTPNLQTKSTSIMNTIFGNLYTRPPPATIVIIPTQTTTDHYTAISMIIDKEQLPNNSSRVVTESYDGRENIKPTWIDSQTYENKSNIMQDEGVLEQRTEDVPTYFVTHTKTLSVTITETTIVQRNGQPSTHTVVMTKTHTSTQVDTITQIQTLLQPTKVLATITTTVPITVLSKEPQEPSTMRPDQSYDDIQANENESIFVVMSDKKSGTAQVVPAPPDVRPTGFEVQVPDETNDISPNDILFSGIYTQHNGDSECRPECKATKNEICQKIENAMRCVCRPGFARMFLDHPCKPTYTYVMKLPLDHQGKKEIIFTEGLTDRSSPSHQHLTQATKEGLDRLVMQSDLRDIYHGIVVSGFEPTGKSQKPLVVYMVQLSENTDEVKLQQEVHKALKANNFSLGGTDVFAVPDMLHSIRAEDFDECSDSKYHDCSENSQCFNLRGTYTCSCKEGFTDLSYNMQFPGRICSADSIGCELCNYHGTCYYKANEDPTCECFQWYAGEFCQVNLKVTLITLIAIGVLLSILLVVCIVMTCNKQQPPEILRTAPKPHVGFRRYRSVTNMSGDKRAIVSVDTSSEGSIERTPPPFIKQRVRNDPLSHSRLSNVMHSDSSHAGGTVQSAEQRDRSLTVLIPRAKYRPASTQPSTLLTMSTFGPEQKLMNYTTSREGSRTPEKKVSRCSLHSRRLSGSTNVSIDHQARKRLSASRRPSSGALVSAGFEVSATVRKTQELDEAYMNQQHNDLNQPTYNSIRTAESSIIVDVPPLPVFESSLDDFITRVDRLGTVSEARSYDETTIQPPVRSLHFSHRGNTCESKHSSSQKTNMDEHHTMGERDLGSTYMPKSQLYKHEHRESDGSNFDSL